MGTEVVKRKSQKVVGRRDGRGKRPMHNNGLAFKFVSEEAFGHFCIRLTEEHVPFRLAGNRTIVILGAKQVSDISDRVRGGLETLKDEGLVEVLSPTLTGKRKLPTAAEADRILEGLIKNF